MPAEHNVTGSHPSVPPSPATPSLLLENNGPSLKRLLRSLQFSQGQFSLILAYCNYDYLRQQVMDEILAKSPIKITQLSLSQSALRLYTNINEIVYPTTLDSLSGAESEGRLANFAVIVLGLEIVEAIEDVLTSINQVRDEFRRSFNFPLVLWVTDEVLNKMIRLAPDFKSWAATTIKFEPTTQELVNLLRSNTEAIFEIHTFHPKNQVGTLPTSSLHDHSQSGLTQPGLTQPALKWRETIAHNLWYFGLDCTVNSQQIKELEFALKDLQNRGEKLEPSVTASLEFILGLDDYSQTKFDQALQHYQQSLIFWRQETALKLLHQWPAQSSLIKQGIVLFHIALTYRDQADQYAKNKGYQTTLANQQKWQETQKILAETIDLFEQAQRPDLAAGTMIYLGEVLKNLEEWEQLEAIATTALSIYFNYLTPAHLAKNNGFLAEIALRKNQWHQAQKLAELALSIITNLSTPDDMIAPQRGIYLWLLAQAQRQLGEWQSAIENLILASDETKWQDEPHLYINILSELRSLYTERGEYFKAFSVKQEQRSIEQQFGFRAFTGAAPLAPKQQVHNLINNGNSKYNLTIAPEIQASAQRQKDINKLLMRMGRDDHKLTIIHGRSGVGKSSLVNAGLVPTLINTVMSARNVLPVVLQIYTNWKKDLKQRLDEALIKLGSENSPLVIKAQESILKIRQNGGKNQPIQPWLPPHPPGTSLPEKEEEVLELGLDQKILVQLGEITNYNWLVVLVFDQFEEFFFSVTELKDRIIFYQFLQDSLNLPFIKIILSLREDYLHYLLELEKMGNWDVINHNILDKQIRYQINDFSMNDAKSVIESLTEKAEFYLEPELIDRLVKDLADETEKIRPIELQVVGAQLQEAHISTLKQYLALGSKPKEVLLKSSIEQVIEDCGKPYADIAWELLYNLTDGKGTRPRKTKSELAQVYQNWAKDNGENNVGIFPVWTLEKNHLIAPSSPSHILDLILEIWVSSGLLLTHHESLDDKSSLSFLRYQLMHDYLVHPIRDRYDIENRLRQAQAEKFKAQVAEKMSQEQLYQANQKLKNLLALAIGGLVLLAGATVAMIGFWQRAVIEKQRAEISTLTAASEALFASNNRFDALMESLRAAQKLRQLEKIVGKKFDLGDTKMTIAASLEQAVYGVKERNRFEGHNDVIWALTFSPDGKIIASGGNDKLIKIWRLNGQFITNLSGHKDSIICLSFSPDGKLLASASMDNTIKLWRVDRLSSLSEGSPTQIKPYQQLTLIGHQDTVTSVSFSPNGQWLASASKDKTVKIWTKDGKLSRTLSHQSTLEAVSFDPTNNLLVSGSDDGTISLWTTEGKLLKTMQHSTMKSLLPVTDPRALKVYSVIFSPNGELIASSGADGTVTIWNKDGIRLRTIAPMSEKVITETREVFTISFTPDSRSIVTAGTDGIIRLWRITGELEKIIPAHNERITNISLSPDGKFLVSASYDKTVKLWQVNDRSLQMLSGHNNRVFSAMFSPNNKLIASAAQDGMIKLWERSGNLLRSWRGHQKRIASIDFSPDGQLLGSGSYDKTVKTWSVATGNLIHNFTGHTDSVMSIDFSPDGQLIASGSKDQTIKIWTVTGELLRTLSGNQGWVNSVKFSPDSRLLVSGNNDGTIKIFNRQGQLIRNIKGHNTYVLGVAFSPDGQLIASAGYDNTIKLWNLQGKLQTTLLTGSSDSVTSVSFSPDGLLLASSSYDKTVKLWSKKGTLLKVLKGHQDSVMSVNFSPDGKILVSASRDRKVILWNLDLDQLWLMGCDWVQDYLSTNPNVGKADRFLCNSRLDDDH